MLSEVSSAADQVRIALASGCMRCWKLGVSDESAMGERGEGKKDAVCLGVLGDDLLSVHV